MVSETHAESDQEKSVSARAFTQNIKLIPRNQSKKGMRNNVSHVRIYHKITLNFFQYKSAIVHVGISKINPIMLLKLHISAICRRSNQM